MKRTSGLFHAVLLAFVICLSGCINDQYSIEKKYWHCSRQAEKIFKNPAASPPKEVEKAVGLLKAFIQRYPNILLSVEAEFNIARIYIAKEDYEQARTHLRMVMNKYSKSDAVCSQALFMTGLTYQLQSKWPAALEQFKKLMQAYPLTVKGLSAPVYIAQYYRVKYQPDKMLTAYHEAIAHYRGIADKDPNSPVSYMMHKMIAQCYLAMKDWKNTLITYETMLEKFKGKARMDDVLMDTALIYYKEIKDKDKAKTALEELLKDPKSKFRKAATALMKEIEKK